MLADKDFESKIRVGKYGVNVENLEKVGVPAIEKALREKKIVIIDEIGNMEIASEKFCATVSKALESDRTVLATIHVHNNPLTDAIKTREDVQTFNLTIGNRASIKQEVVDAIKAAWLR
jgi:nucleoside-triphosphatase